MYMQKLKHKAKAEVKGYSLGHVHTENVTTHSTHLYQTTATKDGAQIEMHLVRTHSQKE